MMYDIFITHAWGTDSLNRDNHLRCKKLCDLLKNKGYIVWFDHYNLIGNIDKSIINGINKSKIIILCLTKLYCGKINKAIYNESYNDNCYKEWNYILFKKKKNNSIINGT